MAHRLPEALGMLLALPTEQRREAQPSTAEVLMREPVTEVLMSTRNYGQSRELLDRASDGRRLELAVCMGRNSP